MGNIFRGFAIATIWQKFSISKTNLHAAAVGARNSVSFPPNIHGPDAAATTVEDNRINSNEVSCGFCPATLSKSCTWKRERVGEREKKKKINQIKSEE